MSEKGHTHRHGAYSDIGIKKNAHASKASRKSTSCVTTIFLKKELTATHGTNARCFMRELRDRNSALFYELWKQFPFTRRKRCFSFYENI